MYSPSRIILKTPLIRLNYPIFQSSITSGETLDDAFHGACEALDVHLESLHKLKKKTPKPRHQLVLKTA